MVIITVLPTKKLGRLLIYDSIFSPRINMSIPGIYALDHNIIICHFYAHIMEPMKRPVTKIFKSLSTFIQNV